MCILRITIFFIIMNSGCISAGSQDIITGAARTGDYLPFLKDKNMGIVANHSSLIGEDHLVDFLLSQDINLVRIFSPEHGFRGDADAGEYIEDGRDSQTGLPITSLYGSNKKPSTGELAGIDIMIFDLQDVGVRFYTYISTLHYVMEACAESGIPLIVFDRPNPNADYIDGPVLEGEYLSFVGMHPVPVVYGMTIGEYAKMINGEKWLDEGLHCELRVIPCKNYSHNSVYEPPVPPSPNLPNYASVRLYPSLCFFEGTRISVGRGTDFPFQVFGHPELKAGNFYFTPVSRPGAAKNPKLNGEKCRGFDLRNDPDAVKSKRLNLQWILKAYHNFPDQDLFFTPYFQLLSGSDEFQKQIELGLSESEIRDSWAEELEEFKKIRSKYLLYDN